MGRDLLRQGNRFATIEAYQGRLKIKSSFLECIGVGDGKDGFVYLICNDCGNVFHKSKSKIRPSRTSRLICPFCQKINSDIEKKKRKEIATQNKIIKHEELLKRRIEEKHRYCRQCGKEFYSNKSQYYFCSDDCRIRFYNKAHDIKRRIKIKSALVDNDISLEKLIKRDKHKCWICGDKVDSSDYEVREDGNFVAGSRYPSIDHVVALSNGGHHSWSNIRLAHRKCNWEKSNKIFDWGKDNQLRLFI